MDLSTYRNIAFLRKGGFGIVYSAKNPRRNQTVAVKLIQITEYSEAELDNVKKEFLLAQTLNHRNIIKVLHSGIDTPSANVSYANKYNSQFVTPVFFIEMEFADLGSLNSWFDANWKTPETAKIFFYQITCGLSYLHEKRIIHRDLKPDNILLMTNTSGNVVIKICDFGISTELRTTMTGNRGTAGYMAPEMVSFFFQ